jgi:hypothetical protein
MAYSPPNGGLVGIISLAAVRGGMPSPARQYTVLAIGQTSDEAISDADHGELSVPPLFDGLLRAGGGRKAPCCTAANFA